MKFLPIKIGVLGDAANLRK